MAEGIKIKRKMITDFAKMKETGDKITYITAYDYLSAKTAERAGIDMILVGDSGGMVSLGYADTFPVTMDDMVRFCQAVRRGAPNTFVVGDMPFMSYQTSNETAIANAGRLIKEGGCDAIKLEGAGEMIAQRVKAIVDAGILVMGHIGLTPQFLGQIGGYKAQGRTAGAAVKLLQQAKVLEGCGTFSVLVEGVPSPVGKAIAETLKIPALSIGAGPYMDGQLLIYADMVGYYDDFTPKFVKKYCNISKILTDAYTEYVKDVKSGAFPVDGEHTYKMSEEEAEEFWKLVKKENK